MYKLHTPTNTFVTPAIAELLVNLGGECGEIMQAQSKLLQHGPGSSDPTSASGETNLQWLEREIGDFMGVTEKLVSLGILNADSIAACSVAKLAKLSVWTHGELAVRNK